MNRSDLKELHFITPLKNLPSILERGIFSNRKAAPLRPVSIADAKVQERRARKKVPGGEALHSYANLYLCARNPMLYARLAEHAQLCVLGASTDVLDIPGAIVADGNAGSDYTAFFPAPSGLERVDAGLVFAERWTDSNPFLYWHKKRVKCAEVLIPTSVESRFINRILVSCEDAAEKVKGMGISLPIVVDGHLFFRP